MATKKLYNKPTNLKTTDEITNATLNAINSNFKSVDDLVTTLKGYGLKENDINNYLNSIKSLNTTNDALIDNLNASSNNIQANLDTAANNLTNQLVMNDILTNQINNATQEYNDIKQENINKMRAVDNNTYYAQMYQSYIDLIKIVIIILIPLLIIIILANKSILPKSIAQILGGIILIVGGAYVIYKLYDLNNRNNMDFTQYNIGDMDFDKIDKNSANKSDGTPNDPSNSSNSSPCVKNIEKNLAMCVGQDCCAGTGLMYDENKGGCVIGNSEKSTNTGNSTGYTNKSSNFLNSLSGINGNLNNIIK